MLNTNCVWSAAERDVIVNVNGKEILGSDEVDVDDVGGIAVEEPEFALIVEVMSVDAAVVFVEGGDVDVVTSAIVVVLIEDNVVVLEATVLAVVVAAVVVVGVDVIVVVVVVEEESVKRVVE